MKRTDLAYTAGIIDGEGCIGIYPYVDKRNGYRQNHMVVSVTSTDEWLCQMLKMGFGGHVYVQAIHQSNHKPQWHWIIQATKANDFLKLIFPYLHLKKPQAELAIKFQDSRRRGRPGKHLSDEQKAIDEVQRILLKSMKHNKATIVEVKCASK